MTIKLETKTEDGITYVKVQGGRGSWGRPVVDDQGNFFRSIRVAGDVLNCSSSTIGKAIAEETIVKGRLFAFATEAEVRKQLTSKTASANGHTTNGHTTKARDDHPFIGVRWPDGSVSIKLSTLEGRGWKFERRSLEDVPEEIRSACRWM